MITGVFSGYYFTFYILKIHIMSITADEKKKIISEFADKK